MRGVLPHGYRASVASGAGNGKLSAGMQTCARLRDPTGRTRETGDNLCTNLRLGLRAAGVGGRPLPIAPSTRLLPPRNHTQPHDPLAVRKAPIQHRSGVAGLLFFLFSAGKSSSSPPHGCLRRSAGCEVAFRNLHQRMAVPLEPRG